MSRVLITPLTDRGDARGGSWSVPVSWEEFLPAVRDLHVTTVLPGHARGNHYHLRRREVIVILHSDSWTLFWDEGEGTPIGRRTFGGRGAVLLLVEPGAAHAVVNTGTSTLQTLGLTGEPYSAADPDTHPRLLSPTRDIRSS